MPLPIVCASESWRQFTAAFQGLFTAAGYLHFVTVLLGLLQTPERRTLSGLRRSVSGAGSLSALSRFCTTAAWATTRLADAWQARFRAQLLPQIPVEHARQRAARPHRRGRPAPTQVTAYAIFDDSAIGKHTQGTTTPMAGVGQHYSTIARGISAGHSLFTGLLFVLGRRCPLPPRLYQQPAVAAAAGVPFRSKIDLLVEALTALQPLPGTTTHVLVDAWYTCQRVWRTALGRGFHITGGLKTNRWRRLPDPAVPERCCKQRLSAYVAGLPSQAFVSVRWRGRWVAAHLVRTFVYKLGACQGLVVKETPDAPPSTARCWATSELTADVATVAQHAATRWEVETYIQEGKELLGLDHYQLTSIASIERFWHLVACAYLYLDEIRATLAAARPTPVTLGEALRHEQAVHQRALLGWLRQQFRQDATVDEVRHRLIA
jgi:hypothetical protein